MAVIDTIGTPVFFDKIFLHAPDKAKEKLNEILTKYNIEVIIVGNGTGVDETVEILQEVTQKEIYIVNES
jgi:uncharacterized protein